MYIIFEGIDTCGKTTQINLLANKFPNVIVTKEPNSKILREILLSNQFTSKKGELFLFLADRAEHYKKIIEPNRDRLILSDRGFLSGIGYALANGECDFEYLIELNRFALNNNLPDLIIFFKIDQTTLQNRVSTKTADLDTIELRGVKYLLSVQSYMESSLKRLNIPHFTIDATCDIGIVHNQIYNRVLLQLIN
jgi:dTMP kinase